MHGSSIPTVAQPKTLEPFSISLFSHSSYPIHQQVLLTISPIQLFLTISVTTTPRQTCHLLQRHNFFTWLQKLFPTSHLPRSNIQLWTQFLTLPPASCATLCTGYITRHYAITRHDACLTALHYNDIIVNLWASSVSCIPVPRPDQGLPQHVTSRTTKLFTARRGHGQTRGLPKSKIGYIWFSVLLLYHPV